MKNLIIFAFLILIPTCGNSQDYELPKMRSHQMNSYYWNDTITTNQILTWENGGKKVDYVNLKNGKKLRREYYLEGRLKIEVEVNQYYSLDTIRTYDLNIGKMTTKIKMGFIDVPDGKYKEYHEPYYSNADIVKTFGQYENGKMIGPWSSKNGALSYIVTATYNSSGNLDGEYCEYYDNFDNPMGQIRIKGNYGRVKTKRLIDGDDIPKEVILSRRIGDWNFFDRDGRIIETTTYKLNKKC